MAEHIGDLINTLKLQEVKQYGSTISPNLGGTYRGMANQTPLLNQTKEF